MAGKGRSTSATDAPAGMASAPSSFDAWCAHHARRRPDSMAAVGGIESISWAALEQRVGRLAAVLAAQGVAPGDRVALTGAPGVMWFVTFLAISRLRAIHVGVNPRYTLYEREHALALTSPVLVLDTDADPLPHPSMDAADSVACAAGDRGDDPVAITFTSGTTGRAKAATLHQRGLLAAAGAQVAAFDPDRVGSDGAERPTRTLCNLPTGHVGCLVNQVATTLITGGALVFQPKFDAGDVLRLITGQRITHWMQVPTMFTLTVTHPDFSGSDLSSLRCIGIGGGAPSAPTLAALRTLGASISVEYGQTETMSSVAFSSAGDSDEVLLNTVGRFHSGFQVRIADDAGRECGPGEIGEIQARGDCTLLRYWDDEPATRAARTASGWLQTGDLASRREDGRIVLHGRRVEMIKSGGYNVYPREVERVLDEHAAVAASIVFALPDAVLGERVVAALYLQDAATMPDAADLETLCRERLAGYKLPRSFHAMKSLPRLGNGKPDRRKIQDAVAAGHLPALTRQAVAAAGANGTEAGSSTGADRRVNPSSVH